MNDLAVVTVVHGRRDHLALQQRALARSRDQGLHRVVVAMDDPGLAGWTPDGGPAPTVLHVARRPGQGLPLAAARNAGARAALTGGAEVLVFLDVDCLPDPGLVGAYRDAARRASTPALLCGPVAYLPPAGPQGYALDDLARLASPHPARPAPEPGEVLEGQDHDLFWSLSFAVTASCWRALGGFCDRYTGYGGEDTDLAAKARLLGMGTTWVGSARAWHQHHPTQDPPRQHLDAILRNARLFHDRWGRWPMTGWLDAFVADGLLVRGGDGYRLPGLVTRC